MQIKRTPKTTKRATATITHSNKIETSDDYDIVVKKTVATKPSENDLPDDLMPKYFTEKDLSRILANLDTLRADVYPNVTTLLLEILFLFASFRHRETH